MASVRFIPRFIRLVVLIGSACCAFAVCADEPGASKRAQLDAILVTGKKLPAVVPDAELQEHVETAMRSDPFFLDDHVTVTIRNGVITLHGMVFDDWDLRVAMRIAGRIPGVKRVVNDLEIKLGGE